MLNLGEQYVDLGQIDDGLPLYRRAVAISRGIFDAHPGDRHWAMGLTEQLEQLAGVERAAGHADVAQQSYAEACAVLEPFAFDVKDTEIHVRLGTDLMGEGRAAADRGLTDEAFRLVRQGVSTLTPFASTSKDSEKPRQRLTEALWEAARLARRVGNPGEAARLDHERRALWKDRPTEELAALALQETAEAGRIGYGRVSLNLQAEAGRRCGLDLAVDNLRLAVSLGFRDAAMICKYPETPLLLSHHDFPLLLRDLSFPANPFPPEPAAAPITSGVRR